MAHDLGSCWFPRLLEAAGFKLCDCKRVHKQGFHLCMALPTPPIESPLRINEEPFRRNEIDRTLATVDAKIRANAVASEKGEETMPVVAPGSGLAYTPETSEQSGEQPEQESEAVIQSSALMNPSPLRHQGTGISRLTSQESVDTDVKIAQGLIDDTARKATASRTIPIRPRPAAKIATEEQYCS